MFGRPYVALHICIIQGKTGIDVKFSEEEKEESRIEKASKSNHCGDLFSEVRVLVFRWKLEFRNLTSLSSTL